MKVHFIISSLGGGGAERVLALMVNSLAKNPSNEISVITLFDKNEDYQLDPAIRRIKLKQLNFLPSHTFRSILRLSLHYKSKTNRPDLIISLITLTNLITIVVAKLFSIKIIVQEHNSYLRYMQDRERVTNFTKKYLYRLADAVTVLTSFDVPFYKKYGAKVQVMPNPCTFIPINTNTHEREKTILAIGSLNRYHHKGFDNLIKIIVPIFKEYPDWKLKIAGSGDEGLKLLKKLADDLNILDKIIFTGFITNVSEEMNKSSIFILPSRFEGLPMVLLEAMSQGMSCIAYNCKTGPSDIIEHNVNGLLVNNQNIEDMQNGLRLLLNNKEIRKNLSEQGIKSLDQFNIETITNRYETLFNEIVGQL